MDWLHGNLDCRLVRNLNRLGGNLTRLVENFYKTGWESESLDYLGLSPKTIWNLNRLFGNLT